MGIGFDDVKIIAAGIVTDGPPTEEQLRAAAVRAETPPVEDVEDVAEDDEDDDEDEDD